MLSSSAPPLNWLCNTRRSDEHLVGVHTPITHHDRPIRECARDIRRARRKHNRIARQTAPLNPPLDPCRRRQTERLRTIDEMNARLRWRRARARRSDRAGEVVTCARRRDGSVASAEPRELTAVDAEQTGGAQQERRLARSR